MILYDEKEIASLNEFGIEIPISSTRVTKTFDKLKSHRILGKRVKDWHIKNVEERINKIDLLRVHSEEYVQKLFSEGLENEIIKAYDLIDSDGNYYRYSPEEAVRPLTQLFDIIISKTSGTVQCCRIALKHGFCFYFSGGMHHAQRGYGNGFCLLNDIVIAIRKLQVENLIKTAWVIDVDVHKGDGTAALTAADESVHTLSIHMAKGWPLDGEQYDEDGRLNLSFVESDIDIAIDSGEEHLYVASLKEGLTKLEKLSQPDIAIVVSGADPYEKDELPSAELLDLSLVQLKERDLLVYNFLKDKGIPRAYLMAGGYGESSWEVYAQFLEWALLDNLGEW